MSERWCSTTDNRNGFADNAASEHSPRHGNLMSVTIGPGVLIDADYDYDYDYALAEDDDRDFAASKDFGEPSAHRFMTRTRAMSIQGGTTEISRNPIGGRTLGLPPDTRTDKGVARQDLPRS